jgi:two-component system, NarL family, response regulator DevR
MTTSVGKISVFLLAENRLLREALAKILNKKADIAVVGSAPLSSGVVLNITASSPQVLLFDPHHNIRGEYPIIPPLRKALPTLKVVMIGMDPDKESFLRAVRDGIAGYMLKDATAPEVADAVRSVAENQAVCPAGLCQALFEYVARQPPAYPNLLVKHHMGLTRREQQLVEMIGRGLTNKEIAVTLGLSEQTIKNHIHRMLRKLGASDRLAAAEMCRTDNSLLPA